MIHIFLAKQFHKYEVKYWKQTTNWEASTACFQESITRLLLNLLMLQSNTLLQGHGVILSLFVSFKVISDMSHYFCAC